MVAADRLRKRLPRSDQVTLIDREARHLFQPSLLWLAVGGRNPDAIQRPLAGLRRRGIDVIQGDISRIDPGARSVTVGGRELRGDAMVIALGVTIQGEKLPLGFVQTATENEAACGAFLRGLVERGLKFEQGLLVVIDGSKGLRKAVGRVFGEMAVVQRCQWHKRENVVSYLPRRLQPVFRCKLAAAYAKPLYPAARAALKTVRAELVGINASAAASLDEGLEETLTLHRLGVFEKLGRSFKTTNGIENLNSLVGQRTDKVDCWRNADQKHRWLGTTLLDIQPRLRKVFGYRHLDRLRAALQRDVLGAAGAKAA